MEEEIQAKFPDKVVRVIDQKDYGFLHAENVVKRHSLKWNKRLCCVA